MDKDLQGSLIEAIQIMVDEAVKKTSYTSSYIGKIKELSGFDCVVEIYGSDTNCKMMEHLQGSIQIGDIVIVQDLFNDKSKKFVQSKIGGVATP